MSVKGKYVVIGNGSPDNRLVAGVKADRLRVAGETIEIASATSSRWKEFLAGRKEWDITTDYLLTTWNIQEVLRVGETYPILVIDSNNTDAYLSGTVICTEAVQDYQIGALAKGSFVFKGTGPLQDAS